MSCKINGRNVTEDQFRAFAQELQEAAKLEQPALEAITRDHEITADEVALAFDHRHEAQRSFTEMYTQHRLPTRALFQNFLPTLNRHGLNDVSFWQSFVTRNPGLWQYVPQDTLEQNPGILDSALEANPELILQIPRSRLYHGNELSTLGNYVWRKRLFVDPHFLERAPLAIRRDRNLIASVSYYQSAVAAYMDDSLKNDVRFLTTMARTNIHTIHAIQDPSLAQRVWSTVLQEIDISRFSELPRGALESYASFRRYFLSEAGPHFLERIHKLESSLQFLNTRSQYAHGRLDPQRSVFFVAAIKENLDYNLAFRTNSVMDTLLMDSRLQVITADIESRLDIVQKVNDFYQRSGLNAHTLIIMAHGDRKLGMRFSSSEPSTFLNEDSAGFVASGLRPHVERSILFLGCSAGITLVKPFVYESVGLELFAPDRSANITNLTVTPSLDLQIEWNYGGRTIHSAGKPQEPIEIPPQINQSESAGG